MLKIKKEWENIENNRKNWKILGKIGKNGNKLEKIKINK